MNARHRFSARLAGLCLGIALNGAHAADTPFMAQVNAALQDWSAGLPARNPGVRVQAEWQPVDPRLNMPVCPHALRVDYLGNRPLGRSTLRLGCDAPAWSLMVSVVIRGFQPVVVVNAPLERGQEIPTSALALEEREVTANTSALFNDVNSLNGYRARRTITRGELLQANMVDPPRMVTKGQTVIIEAGDDQFVVRTEGIALTDGALGGIIRVKNSKSGRMVEGTVIGEGRVRVAL